MANKRTLPKRIELIDEKRGSVLEFDLAHAQRILKLQDTITISKLRLFNTKEYKYEHGLISFVEQPDQSSTDEALGAEG